jgi:hypothetical protein
LDDGRAVISRPKGFSWTKRRRVGILNSACTARRYIIGSGGNVDCGDGMKKAKGNDNVGWRRKTLEQ